MEPDYVNDGRSGVSNMSEKLLGPDGGYDMEEQQQQHSLIVDQVMMSQNAVTGAGTGIGEKQPNQYRDVWAALLFAAAQIALLCLACIWGIPALNFYYAADSSSSSNNKDDDSISFTGVLWLVITSSLAALLVSGLALGVLMRAAHQLIQISLVMTVISNVALVIFFIAQGLWFAVIASLFFLVMAAMYAISVWRRIPFAAANLRVALTAIEANGGLILAAFAVTIAVNGIFSVIWLLAWLGVYVQSADCSNGETCVSHMNPFVSFAFLLTYYWTAQVGKNVLHVTTAGVVGTFWFAPHDASTFCSPAVSDSLWRAGTFSFGSICLGSLLTATLQVLHQLAHAARRHGRGNDFLLCVLECILGFLERLVTYFNKWAYVYIGLYGYDFLTAGKKVIALFVDRGWTAIINDDLVVRVLTLVSIVIGLLTGCVGLLLASVRPGWVDEFGGSSTAVAFLIPALIGNGMAYILMSVVASAVDTVVVAFAEAPLEFERNHPGLSSQLVAAWREVYPEEYGR